MSKAPETTVEPCDNGTDLKITLPAGGEAILSAEDAVLLIRRLAEVRANLSPSFPQQNPSEATLAMHDTRMRWFVVPTDEGGFLLAMMHPGFGWIRMVLDPTMTAELRNTLMGKIARERPPRAN